MRANNRALFLHGGPGLSAGVERLWFGNDLPICWWDQPPVDINAPAPFGQLVASATNQLQIMAHDAGEPVALIAHSFGGQIACALAQKVPELVRNITLLGCAPDPFQSILRLCRRMTNIQSSQALEEAIAVVETCLDKNSFKSLVLCGANHPAYPAAYFGSYSTSTRDRFLTLLPQVQMLNLDTFLATMNDLLDKQPLAPPNIFDKEVIILLGRYDPCLILDDDIVGWQRIFPKSKTHITDASHYIHLELANENWLQLAF